MERFFELGLITLTDYNQLAGRVGLPILRSDRRRFYNHFRLLNEISYDSLGSLIEHHIEDPELRLRKLWFPASKLRLRKASIKNPVYLNYVKQKSDDQNRCIISVGNNRQDTFTYFHERDLWVLRRILIHAEAIRKYQFSIHGIEHSSPLSFYGIVAIYENPV